MTTPLYIFNQETKKYLYLDNRRVLNLPDSDLLNNPDFTKTLDKVDEYLNGQGILGHELVTHCRILNRIYAEDPESDHPCGPEIRNGIIHFVTNGSKELINEDSFSLFFARNAHQEEELAELLTKYTESEFCF